MPVPQMHAIEDLAKEWKVPVAALKRCAEDSGLMVQFGACKKIPDADLGEFIRKCRVKSSQPVSSSASEKVETTPTRSSTGAGKRQHAQDVAKKLKERSQPTSPTKSAAVVPLKRGK